VFEESQIQAEIKSFHFFPLHRRSGLCHPEAVKTRTRDQLQFRNEKAVRFVRDVLGDPDTAQEIAEESLEDYTFAGRALPHYSTECV
jgi:hypothetical protein